MWRSPAQAESFGLRSAHAYDCHLSPATTATTSIRHGAAGDEPGDGRVEHEAAGGDGSGSRNLRRNLSTGARWLDADRAFGHRNFLLADERSVRLARGGRVDSRGRASRRR